jgi:hypothetical protein
MAQHAQTITDSQPGQNSVKTEVRSGEVLYVSGNLIDGREQSVFHLKKGMDPSATVITDSPVIMMPSTRSTVAANAPPETPAMAGVLLIVQAPVKAKASPAEAAAAEPATGKLPKAAMSMSLVGLAGFLALAAFATFRIARKRQPRPPIDSQNWIRL